MNLLNKIQKELKAPKNQFNKFGKYNYRNCEDIQEAVKPLLGDAILILSDGLVELGGRVFVKATATLTDKTESWFADAYAEHAKEQSGMQSAQITGSASSYARKYALNGLFLIDDAKDDDTRAKKGNDAENETSAQNGNQENTPTKTPKTPKKPWLTPDTELWNGVVGRMKSGILIAEVKAHYQITKENEDKLIKESK